MKILFINPPAKDIIASIMPKELEEGLDFMPPLGIMYVAAFVEKNTDYQVEILDAQVEQLDYSQLKKEIKTRNPDIIGMTVLTFTLLDVLKTARLAKEISPKIKIVLGGPHANIYPGETISLPNIDFLVLGEGERVIKELLDNINQPDKLVKIKGLVFKNEDQIINTGQPDFIDDLDALPFPARHLTPYKKYFSIISSNVPVTTMFTSRGCPYQCLFCDRPQLGKNFRARSADNVVDEIQLCEKMGIKEIFVYDDTFAVDRQRVIDICDGIKKREIDIVWDIRTRVNTVDKELLQKLKEAGCQRIHYGIEAGTQKILKILNKGITIEQVKTAFELTKKAGIQAAGYFMLGSPDETREDIKETINLLKKINPDYIHVSITTPYPATGLYQVAKDRQVIIGDPWQKFAQDPKPGFIPPIWEKELSREELNDLLKKSYRSFYLRPSFIFRQIAKLKSPQELFRKAKAAFNLLKI